MNPQVVSLCLAIVTVPAVLIGWSIVAHNMRVWQVRKLARSLPQGTRERILARITDAARGTPCCTLLVPARVSTDDSPGAQRPPPDMMSSHFGGTPYSEAGEEWPSKKTVAVCLPSF